MLSKYLYPIFLLLVVYPVPSFGQSDDIRQFKQIRYEYINIDNSRKNPLIICVPGFTQHNRSPEFLILKDYLSRKGFSILIMNPPQHGEDFTWTKKLNSLGEDEPDDLLDLIEHLNVWEKHNEIHLLGFSIGAKIVLKFSAIPEISNSLKSVVAVAAPYSVNDINMRLSGDITKISEGIISSFYAFDRASLVRIVYMGLVGMKRSLTVFSKSPAKEIPFIKAPTLLLHGSDDWLTKSYHSVKLYYCANDNQPFSLVILNTRTHAEDMLSRDGSTVRNAFLNILDLWFNYINFNDLPEYKESFNSNFFSVLNSTNIKTLLYPRKRISLMSSPTFNELNTNLWISPADQNHSLFTINSVWRLNTNNASRHFFTFGSTKLNKSFFDRFRLGFSFEQEEHNEISTLESYLSFYYSFGSLLQLKRLTYISGINNSFNRKILSADFAFVLLDFQINYGQILQKSNDSQINFNFPLIGNASASYLLGVSYSRFLSSPSNFLPKNNCKVYCIVGPKYPIFKTRIRLTLQYEQNGFKSKTRESIWGAGVSLNFKEK